MKIGIMTKLAVRSKGSGDGVHLPEPDRSSPALIRIAGSESGFRRAPVKSSRLCRTSI